MLQAQTLYITSYVIANDQHKCACVHDTSPFRGTLAKQDGECEQRMWRRWTPDAWLHDSQAQNICYIGLL